MQERAKISRRQILQGAADRFEVTGYGSTSMNDIVSAAQMTKGAVYFHFSSKDELAQAVIEEQHQISISAFTAVAATGAPALEQLVMVCHEMGRQLVAEPIVRAGIRLTLELASADGSQGPYVAWIRELRKLAEAAKLEGDIRDDVEPESVGRVVISAFTGVQLVFERSHQTKRFERPYRTNCSPSCWQAWSPTSDAAPSPNWSDVASKLMRPDPENTPTPG